MKVAAVTKAGGLEYLKIEDRGEPPIGAGELKVRIGASSLNFHDYAVVTGMIPVDLGRIPMSDGAGEVIEVAPDVSDFKPGDGVVSLFFPKWEAGEPDLPKLSGVPGDNRDGFGAEIIVGPASAFTRIPRDYSFSEAATLPCAALTAWRALMTKARIKPGDWVLTQGTGGVSIFAIQFAKAAGAGVISTSSSEEKLEGLKNLGVDHVINYKENSKWGEEAKRITGGRGVDEVIEIGGAGTLGQSITACSIGGHISLIGILAGLAAELPIAQLFSQNITIDGITVGSKEEQEDMIRAIEINRIKPIISDAFKLDDIREAFAHQAAQKHFGKIVLEI
ncbi:MAG: NAD(P)-dependent alcohol dehydrogenase [Gammaproteobacteria bacterium]|nr:NAD(P)-dependent alcohol dehydrogenase [Gammaproteobacteria bacterium]